VRYQIFYITLLRQDRYVGTTRYDTIRKKSLKWTQKLIDQLYLAHVCASISGVYSPSHRAYTVCKRKDNSNDDHCAIRLQR